MNGCLYVNNTQAFIICIAYFSLSVCVLGAFTSAVNVIKNGHVIQTTETTPRQKRRSKSLAGNSKVRYFLILIRKYILTLKYQ